MQEVHRRLFICFFIYFVCLIVAKCDLEHDVEAKHVHGLY